jgi:hypothetical protein
MKLNFAAPSLHFNPFAMTTHNRVRLPRILHLLLHSLVGVVASLPFLFWHAPLWMVIVGLAVVALWVKFTWIDTERKRVYLWVVPPEVEVWDFLGDLLLTELVVIALINPWAVLPAFYLASIISDPS